MMKNKKGFTLVEVALFLAISGLLVAGIISGTNHSLAKQRYNNSVETFKDFLSNIYSQVLYTQTAKVPAGRSGQAIYGKLINFGEEDNSIVHVYTVVGDILSSKEISRISNYSTKRALDRAEITITDDSGSIIEENTYEPKWGSIIEKGNDDLREGETNKLLEKSILIIRSPISGAISTYVSPSIINPHAEGAQSLETYLPEYEHGTARNEYGQFEPSQIDFCLNSDDKWAAGNFRRDIRINKNAHNSSAIEIITDNDEGNKCAE